MTYNDFLTSNHATNGHWNDAPTLPLKSLNKNNVAKSSLNQVEYHAKFLLYLEAVNTPDGNPEMPRRIKDIKSRLEKFSTLEGAQLQEGSLVLLKELFDNLDKKEFTLALEVHKGLLASEDASNSKWLVGVKRFIEVIRDFGC